MMHGGRMYNGFVRDDEVTVAGCAKLSIINFKQWSAAGLSHAGAS